MLPKKGKKQEKPKTKARKKEALEREERLEKWPNARQHKWQQK